MKGARIHHVSRHQAAVKQHGKEHIERYDTAKRQILSGESEGQHGAHPEIDTGAGDRDENRHTVGMKYLLSVLKNIFVCLQTQLPRKKGISVHDQRILLRDGGHK